jgi:chemotaxis protein MotB
MKKLLIVALVLPLLNGCISKKKYDDLLAQKVKMEADLSDRNALIEQNNSKLSDNEKALAALKADTASIGAELRKHTSRLAMFEKENAQLNIYYKNLLNNSGVMTRDLAKQRDELLATRKTIDSLSKSLEDRERKVQELEQVMASKDKAVQDLKNKISGALLNFKENDISVQIKNGKVYVSLAEQLLFQSGSVTVDKKGVSALQQLAKAIKDQRDINILIEGHTDNVPISKKSAYMNDNWDLSVMRATAITRILTSGGVPPGQITASGRGEFSPLASNDTPDNKQKNRRTEIIITPNLDELFKILESN